MDKLIGYRKCAEYFNNTLGIPISYGTLRLWVHRMKIPHYKVGNRVYFDTEEIHDFIKTCKRGTGDEEK